MIHSKWKGTLEELGFKIELTPPSKDGGKDIVAKCKVKNQKRVYFIEVKHWRRGSRPGPTHVSDFLEVNLLNETDGGLFLSSSGYSSPVYRRLSELSKQNIKLGDTTKIVSLCQNFVSKQEGLWIPEHPLPQLLFSETI